MPKYYAHISVEFLDISEAAEYLEVSPEVLRRYGKAGPQFPFFLRFDDDGVKGPLYVQDDLDRNMERLMTEDED